MAVYYKPQSPIQSGEDFIYPITTADQVKVDKDTRLNAVGVYLKNIDDSTDTKKPQNPLTNNGFGIYPLTTADQVILSDGSRLEKNGLITSGDSDKLGGIAASSYALKTDTAPNSSKLGGKTLAEIMLALYPVGAVYISTNSTSPASLFGGTWEQIKGRFLLGTGAPENNDDGTSPGNYDKTLGSKGGEATHKLTESEMPKHYHELIQIGWGGETSATIRNEGAYLVYDPDSQEPLRSDYFGDTGGNQPHNNMPPYLAVYMWKRVADGNV